MNGRPRAAKPSLKSHRPIRCVVEYHERIRKHLRDRTEALLSIEPLPIAIPFALQHRVATAMQDAMEAVCFFVAKKHLPDLLRERKWACPAAANLLTWLATLRVHASQPPTADDAIFSFSTIVAQIKDVLLVVRQVAADRRSASDKQLARGASVALSLLTTAPDKMAEPFMKPYSIRLCIALHALYNRIDEARRAMEAHSAKRDKKRAAIAAQRAALDKEEAVADKEHDDAMANYELQWDESYSASLYASKVI